MCSTQHPEEFLALLKETIPDNFPKIRWKATWCESLLKFYEAQGRPEGFLAVAEQLCASTRQYVNYAMAFRVWWNHHTAWNPSHEIRVIDEQPMGELEKQREGWAKWTSSQ